MILIGGEKNDVNDTCQHSSVRGIMKSAGPTTSFYTDSRTRTCPCVKVYHISDGQGVYVYRTRVREYAANSNSDDNDKVKERAYHSAYKSVWIIKVHYMLE